MKESFEEFADQVSYVSFAPSAGITYHRLAAAVGAKILIYHLHVDPVDSNGDDASDYSGFRTEKVATLEIGKSQVGRDFEGWKCLVKVSFSLQLKPLRLSLKNFENFLNSKNIRFFVSIKKFDFLNRKYHILYHF